MPKKGEKCTEKQLAALKAGKKDFISGDERTKAIQAKGTKAAAEQRTQETERRTFAQLLAEELSIVTKEGKTRKNSIAAGLVEMLNKELAKKNPNGKTVNALYTAIRDTIGEMPTQKIDLNANVKTIGNWRDVLKKENDSTAAPLSEEEPQKERTEETPPPNSQDEQDTATEERQEETREEKEESTPAES